MNNDKGQMSSAFTYIFAIIVGGVIFLFLIGFIFSFIGFSGSLGAAELVTSLDDEFAAFSVSESAEKIVNYGRKLEFTVLRGQITSKGQTATVDHIIYSPFQLEGREIIMATKSLELPYRVTNLFYLSDGNTVYVMVYDDATAQVVDDLQNSFNSIPKNFPNFVFSTEQIQANVQDVVGVTSPFDRVRFVFFTRDDSVLDTIATAGFQSYDILFVSATERDYSYGQVEYPDRQEVIYMTEPMLVGAMVSPDADAYNFNLDVILNKLAVVNDIYTDKTQFISTRLPSCDYAGSKTTLQSYQRVIGDTESYISYKAQVESVEEANKKLGGGCPEIF